MKKQFEDYFSKLQTELVEICIEYVENEADDIFIYCSYEPDMYAFDVFYRIDDQVLLKHELNNVSNRLGKKGHRRINYDVSEQRQEALLDFGLETLKKIHEKCKEFDMEMPTEIKLHYNANSNSLKGNYRYDLVYSNDDELLPDDIFELWINEVKKSNFN